MTKNLPIYWCKVKLVKFHFRGQTKKIDNSYITHTSIVFFEDDAIYNYIGTMFHLIKKCTGKKLSGHDKKKLIEGYEIVKIKKIKVTGYTSW